MRIDEIIAADREPVFSFEFFPPKTEEGERNLYEALTALQALEPAFVSVTWGAGGSTREKTIEIVRNIRATHGLEAMAHFTCVGATVADLRDALDQMREAGIDNVLTLRGDPPRGETEFVPTEGGLRYATELAQLAADDYDFCLVGACYPEVHPEAPDGETDLAHLKEKVDAGVKVLITQLFFDNEAYFRFVEEARGAGIDVPIVPGIMPITNAEQIKRFTQLCGATIPQPLLDALDAADGERPERYDWIALPEAFDRNLELPALATSAPELMACA
ncbi:MAG TPA: methylenetetrahydrofolate reductase, partial [Conexibacter sp.]|nr:methylenetetrahydrofolate reductase [Conexibacter sp.]